MGCYIGITCGWQESGHKHQLSDEYVRAVQAAGGTPLLLPSVPPELAGYYCQLVDGIIFSGGDDLDPLFFGEEPQLGQGEITPRRDAFELQLSRLVLAGKKPALAICRGMQVVNVSAGGSIYQDLGGVTTLLHKQQAPRWYPTHRVDIEEHSRLYRVIKKPGIRVNTFHHQGVNKVGQGLKAVAWSGDGLIEGLETTDPAHFLLGVQWHPECNWEKDEASFNLFKALVENVWRE